MEFIFDLILRGVYYYLLMCLFCIVLYCKILLVLKLTPLGSKIHYYLWKTAILYPLVLIPGLLTPILLLRPWHVVNGKICAWCIRKVSYVTGITWELRNANVAGTDQGAVICCNHQSDVDIFAQFNVWSAFVQMTAVAKKELFYVFPFGPAAWLCGLKYIDRSSTKKSYETLLSVTKVMSDENVKIWIYPEGTRNNKGGFLPFKKGAFVMAIQAQVPIMPVVIAPYYYMDEQKGKVLFKKRHNIVSVLDPIPTKGLTTADVEDLKRKTEEIMLKEYEILKKEVTLKAKDPNWTNKSRPRMRLIFSYASAYEYSH